MAAHFWVRVSVLITKVAMVTVKESTRVQQEKRVELPALYPCKSSNVKTQTNHPTFKFISKLHSLSYKYLKKNFKGSFFNTWNVLELIICHSQILIGMNYFMEKCTAFLPSNYYFEGEWRLDKFKGYRACNTKGFWTQGGQRPKNT